MKFSKYSASNKAIKVLFGLINLLSLCNGCNFGFGNLGIGNFGFANVGIGNKGFLNGGLLNIGFANAGIRNIGALNLAPLPNTISVFNIPIAPNLTPLVGKRKRRATLRYPLTSPSKRFPWSK